MPAEFVLPAGIVWTAPPDPLPEEGYELAWREDEEPPRYFFYAQLSVLRTERVFTGALSLLPPRVRAILELRRDDDTREADPEGPEHDRWVSPEVDLAEVMRVFGKYSVQILHDGTVGFGAFDPDSPAEAFLDDHKHLTFFAEDPEAFTALLDRHGVPQVEHVASVLDVAHEHLSLPEVAERCRDPRRDWMRRRTFDPRWYIPAIRRALKMKLQDPEETEPGDDEDPAGA
ncbi:MAG: hypothetical protein HMLKMBBP_02093 [Planctomycetes bacterium]|nr:hypothetical protein [Planctomycetota bacterium]